MENTSRYSESKDTQEDMNWYDKYSETGESEFSREVTVPFDENEVLSERHFTITNRFRPSADRNHYASNRSHDVNDFRGRGPKGYERSDARIKEDVSEALYRCTQVDASDIEVFVESGHVTLKGTVADRSQKKWAERTVEHISGVIDVYNSITLQMTEDKNSSRRGLIQNTTGLN